MTLIELILSVYDRNEACELVVYKVGDRRTVGRYVPGQPRGKFKDGEGFLVGFNDGNEPIWFNPYATYNDLFEETDMSAEYPDSWVQVSGIAALWYALERSYVIKYLCSSCNPIFIRYKDGRWETSSRSGSWKPAYSEFMPSITHVTDNKLWGIQKNWDWDKE